MRTIKRLDALARDICAALADRFGPCSHDVDVDEEGATIELLAECHGDAWLHLVYLNEDEARAVLASLQELPTAECEDACMSVLGLTREMLADPVRRRS
jgi:hypothetical protein